MFVASRSTIGIDAVRVARDNRFVCDTGAAADPGAAPFEMIVTGWSLATTSRHRCDACIGKVATAFAAQSPIQDQGGAVVKNADGADITFDCGGPLTKFFGGQRREWSRQIDPPGPDG